MKAGIVTEYREDVLRARVSVEQAAVFGWESYAVSSGHRIGISTFGASAPLKELQTRFGFALEPIFEAARKQIARHAA